MILDASRHALHLHAWLTSPDFDQCFPGRRSIHGRDAAGLGDLARVPLSIAVKNATALLDRFCREGIAIEVTHRSKRRLYNLAGLAPLRDGVAAPRPPESRAGAGDVHRCIALNHRRCHLHRLFPARPLTPLERRVLDYTDLENAMALADERIREARRTLAGLLSAPPSVSADLASEGESPAALATAQDGV